MADGETICELCGTAVENIASEKEKLNGFVDPFWSAVPTNGNTAKTNDEFSEKDFIQGEDEKTKTQETPQSINNDPFENIPVGTVNTNEKKECPKDDLTVNNVQNAFDEHEKTDNAQEVGADNNFQYRPENANYGMERNGKIVIIVMAMVIAVLTGTIICLCVTMNNYIEARENATRAEEDKHYTSNDTEDDDEYYYKEPSYSVKNSSSNYNAEDIIRYVYVNDDYSVADEDPNYCQLTDYGAEYEMEYPVNFEKIENIIKDEEYFRYTWVNEEETAVLRVCVCKNVNIAPLELQNAFAQMYAGNVTYSPLYDDWFAISIDDGMYYHYAYYTTDNNRVRGFEFHFSGAENLPIYSQYIDHIYESFGSV